MKYESEHIFSTFNFFAFLKDPENDEFEMRNYMDSFFNWAAKRVVKMKFFIPKSENLFFIVM